jgi:glutamate racemase
MEAIRKTVGNSVALINMGVSTARAVRNELKARDLLNEDDTPAIRELFVSDKTPAFRQVAEILLGDKIDDSDVSVVDVSRI